MRLGVLGSMFFYFFFSFSSFPWARLEQLDSFLRVLKLLNVILLFFSIKLLLLLLLYQCLCKPSSLISKWRRKTKTGYANWTKIAWLHMKPMALGSVRRTNRKLCLFTSRQKSKYWEVSYLRKLETEAWVRDSTTNQFIIPTWWMNYTSCKM